MPRQQIGNVISINLESEQSRTFLVDCCTFVFTASLPGWGFWGFGPIVSGLTSPSKYGVNSQEIHSDMETISGTGGTCRVLLDQAYQRYKGMISLRYIGDEHV